MNTAATQNFHLIDDLDVAVVIHAAIERIQGLGTKTGRVINTLVQRSNERRALARLDDRMLTDIGMTRAHVDRETSKYCWQQ